MQEHRAWAHLGATPRDLSHDLLEQKHGGADPTRWRWGEGTPFADVFAADEAKRKHESLKAKVAALQQVSSGERSHAEAQQEPEACTGPADQQ